MTLQPDLPLNGLYGDVILKHFRNPKCREPLKQSDVEIEEFNPFCGDRVKLKIQFDRLGSICRISNEVEGCSILQATASMMSEILVGKNRESILFIDRHFRSLLQGDNGSEALGDLVAMKVVRDYPVRIKCALLPWLALEEGLDQYERDCTK